MENNMSYFARYSLVAKRAENMSTIGINYYLQKMCEWYGKIVILNRLNAIFDDTHLASIYLYSSTPIPEIIFNNTSNFKTERRHSIYPGQMTKYSFVDKKDIQQFFISLKKISRPEVFLDADTLLFDYYGKDGLRLRSLTYNSPPKFILDGILGALEFMEDENRKNELHEIEKEIKKTQLQKEQFMMIAERERAVREVAYNKALLENANTSLVVKTYIKDNVQYYQDKINQLNDGLGIEVQKIDIKV